MDRQITWGFTGEPATLEQILSHVGRGWHPLVTKLIEDLLASGWDGSLDQIKEKFGGLRFYITNWDATLADLIQEAEHKSVTLCETCGKLGQITYNGGWMKTACPEHADPESVTSCDI